MTGKWDALIAEAERHAQNAQDDALEAYAYAFRRLATALREAQAHVPPLGWRVTEYTREDGAWCREDEVAWTAGEGADRVLYNCETLETEEFPTAVAAMAAMAAIEEVK